MINKQATRTFDCIAYKDRVQAEMHEETKGMSWDEFRGYLRQRIEQGPFAEFWSELMQRQSRDDDNARA